MRRNKSLMAALLCGALCALCVFLYVSGVEDALKEERKQLLAQYGGKQVEVYVAKRDLEAGETLTEAGVEKRLWVSELLPKDAVTNLEKVEGKPLATPLYEGEVASMKHLEATNPEALTVPSGLCAVSVASEPVLAVGGSVSSGQQVDMYSASGTSTDLIAGNVEVLSTSAASAGASGDADIAWITVAVEPDLVKEVIMAAQTSKLYFALPSDAGEQEGIHG